MAILSRCTDHRPVLWKIVVLQAHHHSHAVGTRQTTFKTSAFFAKARTLALTASAKRSERNTFDYLFLALSQQAHSCSGSLLNASIGNQETEDRVREERGPFHERYNSDSRCQSSFTGSASVAFRSNSVL